MTLLQCRKFCGTCMPLCFTADARRHGLAHCAKFIVNFPFTRRALAAAVTAAPLLGSVRPAAAADDQQGVASSRMSYSRFLEYLDMGRVKKVTPSVCGNTDSRPCC